MRFRNIAGMCLMSASCLLKPSILPAAVPTTVDVIVPEVIIVWPQAKIYLTAPDGDSSVEAAVNGGVMRTVSGFLAAPGASGDYWLSVASRDRAGNVSDVTWSFLRVDGEPPTLGLVFEPEPVTDEQGRDWMPPDGRVIAEASDAVAGIGSVSLGAGDVVETSQGEGKAVLSFSWSEDTAPLSVWSEASDVVGNEAERLAREIHVDARPPTGEIVIEGPRARTDSGLVLGPDARLKGRVADQESGLRDWTALLDGVEVPASTWDGPWEERTYSASASVVDRVGNTTRVAPFEFKVDRTPPQVSWRVQGTRSFTRDGVEYHRSPVRLEALATDTLAGVSSLEWSRDGEQFLALDGEVVSDGDAIYLRVTDAVGNRHDERASWRTDNEPPVLFVETADGTRHPAGATIRMEVGDEIRVIAEDEGAGVSRVSRDASGKTVLPNGTFRFLSVGGRVFQAMAEDNLGHREVSAWRLIIQREGSDR